jgi:hypothetical protein
MVFLTELFARARLSSDTIKAMKGTDRRALPDAQRAMPWLQAPPPDLDDDTLELTGEQGSK